MVTVYETTSAEKAFAFLALLTASLPKGHYTADAGRWATAICAIREKYRATHPHLFRYLHFRRAPRADSYSPEVSNFLGFLQFVNATITHRRGDTTTMEFKQSARELLLERGKALLNFEDLSLIEQMSREIADQLRK